MSRMTCTQSCVASFPRKSWLSSPSRSRQSTPGTASRSASVRFIRLPKRTRPECYDFRRDLDEAHAPGKPPTREKDDRVIMAVRTAQPDIVPGVQDFTGRAGLG